MSVAVVVAGLVVVWIALVALGASLPRRPRPGQTDAALVMWLIRVYARAVQRLEVRGLEHVPREDDPGPLVVIANHTGGVDPVLVQSALHFEVSWMMGRDMMSPALGELWAFAGVIPVDRAGPDPASARSAIGVLKRGGVVGVFPEGRIARPRGRILPWQPGAGLLVSRTGARVLQVVITGTPAATTASGSILRFGRAVLTFLPMRDYTGVKPGEIVADCRRRCAELTGWTLDEPDDEPGSAAAGEPFTGPGELRPRS
jgi:1-acyl-sn-glycerol-3-phosphate acyltransferase